MSQTSTSESQIVPGTRRRRRFFIALLGAAGWSLAGGRGCRIVHYKRAMEEIESDVMAGRYAIASRNLEKLLLWKSDPNGGIVYLLGSCELARGRSEAAGEAGHGWRRVPILGASDSGAHAALSMNPGGLRKRSGLSKTRPEIRRNDKTALLVLLVPMFSQLGRIDEAERLIEDRWEHLNARGEGALEPAIKLLRQHIDPSWRTIPVENIPPFSTRPLGWLPRTIGSGWVEQTWRSALAPTTRRAGGSMRASEAGRMMSRPGEPV